MESVFANIRFALRNLRKHPAFAVVAVATIALGIGANTAIYSVVRAVLLRDLPYSQPSELVRVWSTNQERGVDRGFMSPPDIEDYQAQNRTFDDLAAFSEAELAVIDAQGSAAKVTGTWAGENLFSVLGVSALHGRTLAPGDGAPGAPLVAVLGHAFWQNRFGGDPSAIGMSIRVEEQDYAVVGVMRPGFDFPGNSSFWLNRHLMAYPGRYARWMDVVGRLAPGVDIEAARADLATIAGRLAAEYPDWNRAYGTALLPLQEATVGDTRTPLLILLGAAAFLLLIACVNVINLLLSRMADRGREIAVRAALGAGRARLGRQLMTESLVLAFIGAVVGLVFARLGIGVLAALGPADLPRLDEVRLDGGVLLFTLGSTVLTGLLFGSAPVLWLARTDIQAALQEGSRSTTAGAAREKLRSGLVIAEIALATMLVIGAGLLTRSFSELMETDPGFNSTSLLTFQVDLPSGEYQELTRVADYHVTLTQRLEALPGVRSVAATATLPFDRDVPFLGDFVIEGRPEPRQGEEPKAYYRQVTPGYLGTLGISLVTGRDLEIRDDREAPGAVVINEALARRYFPDDDPIGERISGLPPHLALGGFLVEEFEIVGVAADVRYFGLSESARPSLYLPVSQAPFRRMSFAVRATGDPDALTRAARAEVTGLDPAVPVSRIDTMERIVSASVARERFSMVLLGLFAAVALTLAAVGIYGVISYSISRRTAELGIRMAVGASSADVLKMVMVQGTKLAGWGLGAGLVAAAILSRVMSSQLYGVSAMDPWTFLGVALVLGLVAVVATYIPAHRAARIDPALTIQGEGQ